MEAVERFLEENVRNDSNIVIGYCPDGIQQYYPWIPLRHARKIGELARKETIKEVCEWIKKNAYSYTWCEFHQHERGIETGKLIEDLKKYLEGMV